MELYVENILSDATSTHRVRREATASLAPAVGVTYARWKIFLSFLIPDLVSFSMVMGLMYIISSQIQIVSPVFTLIMPVLGILAIAFALSGLYYAIGLHPAQELRAVARVILVVFLAYIFALILIEINLANLTMALVATLVLVLVLVPTGRAIARVTFSRASWWGVPVVVMASQEAGRAVIRTLERWPELGFRPVALLHDELDGSVLSDKEGTEDPLLEMTSLAPMMATLHKIPYAIVAMPHIEHSKLAEILGRSSKFFRRVIVINDVTNMLALWTTRQHNAVLMGYDIEHAMRSRLANLAKRIVDVLGALVGLLVLLPFLATIAVLIKLDSPGPVLYRQIRMTRQGRCFSVLKFRSMYINAEKKLKELLAKDQTLNEEYRKYHKLRSDPRVTSVGKWLRRYSLDELPQLWNVVTGNLSLVGPRAYMPRELSEMNGYNQIILQNRPGITGLWQVSGRNQLAFEERLVMDVHYVFNWTPWLDLYILARTVLVVLTGEGAS